jgi:hypothetical protein
MNTMRLLTASALLLGAQSLFAWGEDGHRIIGRAAFGLLDDTARSQVAEILGDPAPAEMGDSLSRACNWPDYVRELDEWKWSSPLHYVNIPRHSSEYDRERDCREGRCVTEGVLHFAGQLSHEDIADEKRWQAFAFVCHLVGDLHQPLHAGFRDDRGGNTVEIEYRGEEWNLHQFWDSVLIRAYLDGEDQMVDQLLRSAETEAAGDWRTGEVKDWTEGSHALAAEKAYPESKVIDEAFAGQSWEIAQTQWALAAGRLARLLNSVLGNGEVVVSE